MSNKPRCDDDEYSYPLHMSGSASTLPPVDADDIVAKLHAVILEVTRKPVVQPEKPRMGFLP